MSKVIMSQEFCTSFLFALLGSTVGSIAAREKWEAPYLILTVAWAMTVFGFTLMNQVFFFSWFTWPINVLTSASALVAPAIAYRFHLSGEGSSLNDDPSWTRYFFGGALLLASALVALTSGSFIQDLVRKAVVSSSARGLALVLFVAILVGLSGIATIVRRRI